MTFVAAIGYKLKESLFDCLMMNKCRPICFENSQATMSTQDTGIQNLSTKKTPKVHVFGVSKVPVIY